MAGPEISVISQLFPLKGIFQKMEKGLGIGSGGEVKSLEGDPQAVLQKLIDGYIALSGEIVKNILGPVFAKYPTIKLQIK